MKKNVFCIIYSKEATPYENYKMFDNEPTKKLMNIPMVAIVSRWDGKLGFIGGNMDETDKDIYHAVQREVREEINYNLDISKIKHFRTMIDEKRGYENHTFVCKVSFDELKKIQKASLEAEDFLAENQGLILQQIHSISIPNLKGQIFSGTGKEELFELIKEEELDSFN